MKKIWHPWYKWECYKEGFYNSCYNIGILKKDAEQKYRDFLSCSWQFETSLDCVIHQWKYSCEHFLTNIHINRIAWLGQASMVYSKGIPSEARGGFKLMPLSDQKKADTLAMEYLNKWIITHEKKNKQLHIKMERAWLSRGYTR
jgi:hypothetical protein